MIPNHIKEKISIKLNDEEIIDSEWGLYHKETIQNIINSYIYNPKTVYIFLITDSCDSFIIPKNIKLYRTSLLKSHKADNEYILPYIWEGFEQFHPLELIEKPIVGFCGLVSPYRLKTIQLIQQDNRIISNFILRDHFWGGKPHDTEIVKDFLDNMKSSHFNICNRGAGNFSMRFYQTLSCGRIPILLNTDMLLPYEDEINWNEIIIMADKEEELIDKILDCDIIKRQIRCREIYDIYFAGTKFLDRQILQSRLHLVN
jgi:hypothetical protein